MKPTILRAFSILGELLTYVRKLGFRGFTVWSHIYFNKLTRRTEIRLRPWPDHGPIYIRNNKADSFVLRGILGGSEYDINQLECYERIFIHYNNIRKRNIVPLIVDCGANIGISTICFRRQFPYSHIIAIEPEEQNLNLLCKNCEGYDNIDIIKAGIWSESGFLEIVNDDVLSNSFQVKVTSHGTKPCIRACTINEIYENKGEGFAPFIVKIDIEGAEHEVFSKNIEWFARTPLVIIELHDRLFIGGGNSRPVLRAMADHDRDFLYRGESIFSIKNKH